jgi:hypothetical protein
MCEAAGVPVSNHFYQEMSAHLLALSSCTHYLEYFGLADAVLARASVPLGGLVKPDDLPGSGISGTRTQLRITPLFSSKPTPSRTLMRSRTSSSWPRACGCIECWLLLTTTSRVLHGRERPLSRMGQATGSLSASD